MDAPVYPSQPSGSGGGMLRTLAIVVGIILLGLVGFAFYNYMRRRSGLSEVSLAGTEASDDKAPAPIDGKTRTVIPAAEITGNGSDYGIQFWMYISDWDYGFGRPKSILKRVGTNTSTNNPDITLHPTDNSLQVTVSVYPNDNVAGAATPSSSSTGDSFTCTVENVPLQSWFSVSVTVFQRNMDIYLNGRLVKSCVLPGVPKPAVGDIILADKEGFSGSLCNVFTYGRMLTPSDAKDFFSNGTKCNAPAPEVSKAAPVDKDSTFIRIFGYTFRFSRLSREGKELNSYTF